MAEPDCDRPIIVWLRQDLRLADHPALWAAVESGSPVIPVYVLDQANHELSPGGASRWWLHHSLAALTRDLRRRGGTLILRRAPEPAAAIEALAKETGAQGVYWGRRYAAAEVAADQALKARLVAMGLAARSFNTSLLFEPWTIESKTGGPYRVFTPFWRACCDAPEPAAPHPAPAVVPAPAHLPPGDRLEDWHLLPTTPDWAAEFASAWQPGEAGAAARLERFLDEALAGYRTARDRPDRNGTARLSPHLRFGEISPRQVWHAVRHHLTTAKHPPDADADAFLAELGWREFCYSLLHYNPGIAREPLRAEFRDFPWDRDAASLRAWQRGRTGYPIVDAGMRQLWATGWMHNRVRMIVASFLVKHLLQPWRSGERWFWDTLVDADPANNAANWQWVAGCGADAAPYFRIFNPVLQGRKFDPDGVYVRRWVPELAGLEGARIHEPWKSATPYPAPIIELGAGRARALAAYASLAEP